MPHLGDHVGVVLTIDEKISIAKPTSSRSLKNYDQFKLNSKLSSEVWLVEADSVQEYWNILEDKLISIVDELIQ
jgi:hypothetical protein